MFDVDIEDGKPPLKLPYNLSQNPYEAATKFIQDNRLPITYLDTVANFITNNTKGATLGPSQDQSSPGYDPWGTESRYRPGGETSTLPNLPSAPKILPQKTYLSILVSRPDSQLPPPIFSILAHDKQTCKRRSNNLIMASSKAAKKIYHLTLLSSPSFKVCADISIPPMQLRPLKR